ncbi:Putative ketoacyl reductase [Anatilimnocola aggregata]|uniref:Ketoacyl reductase n=1 Tax=Anatilimnocola aggregata TaxID=2528021 RepID=A0A517YJK6_9BACT|nr:SDR family oxidoreductase [Anatilimnocola aggregata]QDU30395.1 Putative ketoacyl reductase [Anatilimnocola aggregata]
MRFITKSLVGLSAAWGVYQFGRVLVQQTRHFYWAGKIAIVTGGSRGLGLVLARQLVAQGVKVTICARTAADVAAATRELRDAGGDVLGLVCDVRDQAQVNAVVESTVRHWGSIDLLFNVAGIMQVGPLDAMTVEDFRTAMNINCFGALHSVLAVLPTMRRNRWGRIVNVASIGGKRAVPHMIPYDTSKFALVGLSNGLRTELAKDGILVTTACPSLMCTGSPRNATFKGQHRQEYAWFSIGGSLPVVALTAESAARQILNACQNGDGEVYIANLFSPPVWASELAPTLTAEILALINRFLPAMGGIGQRAAYGYESESSVSPSWITALGDAAAERNNEMRPRPDESSLPLSTTGVFR